MLYGELCEGDSALLLNPSRSKVVSLQVSNNLLLFLVITLSVKGQLAPGMGHVRFTHWRALLFRYERQPSPALISARLGSLCHYNAMLGCPLCVSLSCLPALLHSC